MEIFTDKNKKKKKRTHTFITEIDQTYYFFQLLNRILNDENKRIKWIKQKRKKKRNESTRTHICSI